MSKIYRLITQFLKTLAKPAPPPDPLTHFTPHEWADLPIHHPCCD